MSTPTTKEQKWEQAASFSSEQGDSNRGRHTNQSPKEFRRSADYWFDDGNIILIVEGTIFRVHTGVLSRRSEFFRLLFTLPQPSDADNKIEGCPTVTLADSLEDIGGMLFMIYDATPELPVENTPSLERILSMLRMGTKYEMNAIKSVALKRLEKCFPSRLQDFRSSLWSDQALVETDLVGVAKLVRIANELGLHHLLPSAFLRLAMGHESSLVDCVDELSKDELKLVMVLGHILRSEQLKALTPLLIRTTHPDCESKDMCQRVQTEIIQALLASNSLVPIELFTPSNSWFGERMSWVLEADNSWSRDLLCCHCRKLVISYREKTREEMWVKLGGHCGVEPWPPEQETTIRGSLSEDQICMAYSPIPSYPMKITDCYSHVLEHERCGFRIIREHSILDLRTESERDCAQSIAQCDTRVRVPET